MRKSCGSVSPPTPSAPTFRNDRRERPSQKRREGPGMVSMMGTGVGSTDEFAHGLETVFDQVMGAPGEVGRGP